MPAHIASYYSASYALVPIGSVLGATIFQDLIHAMLLSIFGAVVGFLVRLLLDRLYATYRADKSRFNRTKPKPQGNANTDKRQDR